MVVGAVNRAGSNGLALRVTFHYLLLPADKDGAHIGSLALGLGF